VEEKISNPESGVPASAEKRLDFTLEDFETGRVFEHITSIKDPYDQGMEEERLAKSAGEFGFKSFKKLLGLYRKKLQSISAQGIAEDGISEFGEQPFELITGEWQATENGVWKRGMNGPVIACSHPIFPAQVLRSVDTGLVKIKLAYRTGSAGKKPWQYITVPKSRISKASDIIALSDNDISVTSGERAQALVDYLRDVLDLNKDTIPEVESISRMGWNDDFNGFAPYIGCTSFDSADTFNSVYKELRQCGTLEDWMAEALEARTYSLGGRIALAASFASALVEPTGALPFFVHFWAVGSGTGKTVVQMLGASVWGNPSVGGGYFKTFKGTTVGFEVMAGFLHSLPLFLDELQLSKDRQGKVVFNVYELAAGTGKARSNKQLGLDYTPKWDNCFITSGESPMTEYADGAGALNRVLDINCTGKKLIRNGRRTANNLKRNYGHAGKIFVENLLLYGLDNVRELYERIYTECVHGDTTEKQAMAAALILTADKLATDWIFRDGRALTVDDIAVFMRDEKEVSLTERGYEYACGWVASNINQFSPSIERGERYGIISELGNVAIINRVIWDKMCAGAGISSKALLAGLKNENLIETGVKGYTKTKYIDGISLNCVWLKLPKNSEADGEDGDLLPL